MSRTLKSLRKCTYVTCWKTFLSLTQGEGLPRGGAILLSKSGGYSSNAKRNESREEEEDKGEKERQRDKERERESQGNNEQTINRQHILYLFQARH